MSNPNVSELESLIQSPAEESHEASSSEELTQEPSSKETEEQPKHQRKPSENSIDSSFEITNDLRNIKSEIAKLRSEVDDVRRRSQVQPPPSILREPPHDTPRKEHKKKDVKSILSKHGADILTVVIVVLTVILICIQLFRDKRKKEKSERDDSHETAGPE